MRRELRGMKSAWRLATYSIDIDADPLQAFRVEPLVFAIFVVAPDHGAE